LLSLSSLGLLGLPWLRFALLSPYTSWFLVSIYICSSLTECLCLYLHQGIRPPYCPSLPINKICQ
jgi:hypothetical protein